jgi:hypothetical protein
VRNTVATVGVIEPARAQEKRTDGRKKADISYPEAAEEARQNTPPTGDASVYVLRPRKILGMAACLFLQLDNRTWGGLDNGQYSWDPLSPGEHSFKRLGSVSLQADAGKTYYIVLSAGGLGPGGVKVVSQQEGENIRRTLSLNPNRWLLRQYLANWPSVRLGMTVAEVKALLRMSDGQAVFEGEPNESNGFQRLETVNVDIQPQIAAHYPDCKYQVERMGREWKPTYIDPV